MNTRPNFPQPLDIADHDALWQWIQRHYRAEGEWRTLWLNGLPLGRLNLQWHEQIVKDWQGGLEIRADGLALNADNWLAMGDSLQYMAAKWSRSGLLKGWRNECFDVFDTEGKPLFVLERAAFRPLGLQSHAVHVNGLACADEQWQFWIGRRSPYKAVAPDKLDNLVGGGITAGESALEALVRESQEEAGLPSDLFCHAETVSRLHSVRSVPRGLHDEILHVFDVVLPPGFEPENQDGEVASFSLFTVADLTAAMHKDLLMDDSLLVTLDAFRRFGLLLPDHPLTQWLRSRQVGGQ
ncbi:DUF4743 domain-containing protein [Neisseria sp. ZJ106]|uniref:DUF4743 domain-containing protein n=1 Tax=Neisseria lisongii TaxID=2912188 RepID=A0ABY7RJK7_9NEIS|nr:DUF4743 domain-containing protein [Neisseria lisongii]MCF7520640.1 DUF4743 domain-containing protein [Neisseria lisongii]WCL71426.1 DUF4743 domain-containing protein [Neisseria lisongii]